MKVGILGSGGVGQTLAAGFLKHNHQVVVGTREPEAKEQGPAFTGPCQRRTTTDGRPTTIF